MALPILNPNCSATQAGKTGFPPTSPTPLPSVGRRGLGEYERRTLRALFTGGPPVDPGRIPAACGTTASAVYDPLGAAVGRAAGRQSAVSLVGGAVDGGSGVGSQYFLAESGQTVQPGGGRLVSCV